MTKDVKTTCDGPDCGEKRNGPTQKHTLFQLNGEMTMVDNQYDKRDRVKRGAVIIAGSLKMATYHVRDLETDEWGPQQFHATYDNQVLAMMSEETAKLFAKFINSTLTGENDG